VGPAGGELLHRDGGTATTVLQRNNSTFASGKVNKTYILYKTCAICRCYHFAMETSSHASGNGASPASAPTFQPLYEQIKTLITRSLVAGEWKPGEAIPSEMELAARFGVSQGTVRKAIDAMAAEFILVRRQGKGTFVATHTAPAHQYRFLRVRADGAAPDSPKHHPVTRFLALAKGKADVQTAAKLGLRLNQATVQVSRVLVFDSRPLIFDQITLAQAAFPNLTMEKLVASQGSIYSFLETVYGTRMIRADEQIKAVAAAREAAKHLAVPIGTPLLSVDRVAYTYGDKAVEWRRGLCLTQGYSYCNALA
jgi:GntR family transcriptional regulator